MLQHSGPGTRPPAARLGLLPTITPTRGLHRRVLAAAPEALPDSIDATTRPPAVLVVAHGALFRALRAAMGIEPNIRTQNAVPIFCEPPRLRGTAWVFSPVV